MQTEPAQATSAEAQTEAPFKEAKEGVDMEVQVASSTKEKLLQTETRETHELSI